MCGKILNYILDANARLKIQNICICYKTNIIWEKIYLCIKFAWGLGQSFVGFLRKKKYKRKKTNNLCVFLYHGSHIVKYEQWAYIMEVKIKHNEHV